jgi:hypothetical protein
LDNARGNLCGSAAACGFNAFDGKGLITDILDDERMFHILALRYGAEVEFGLDYFDPLSRVGDAGSGDC